MVLASGTAAAALAAALVIALTPPRSSDPTAVTATTIAVASQLRDTEPRPIERNAVVQIERSTVTQDNALALFGAPRAVSAAPDAHTRNLTASVSSVPQPDDPVLVLTRSHAYDLSWSDIEQVSAPDGSVVVTPDGALIGVFADGVLTVLVD